MQKVGVPLYQRELAQELIKENGGIAKTADLVLAGIKKENIALLCKKGYIERIRQGVYQLTNSNEIPEEKLLLALLPQGIVCMESALFHYGYSDFTPRAWSVAVPRSASRAVRMVNQMPIKAYYIPKEYFVIGRKIENFHGLDLPVYDRERTICDCFKNRNKLDHEIFNKAIKRYVVDDQKNLANLSAYAKEMKLYHKVMPLMEVFIND